MYEQAKQTYQSTLAEIREAGLFKEERFINSPQKARIKLQSGKEVLNLCANNYLGLADHPELIKAAHEALDRWGYGMASVRFICGTQELHKELESKISSFLKTEDTILYSSCWDANGGVFETLLGPDDAVISDELNHASIIDGIRLCKADRHRYKNNDLNDLEEKLKLTEKAKIRMIVTDGVFSMDGYIANLKGVCELAEKYNALVMVDDSHAVGFIGKTGRGTPELCGVMDRVDIITGTLGKALGGASGGYVSSKKEIVDLLRQRSRPYLFSNTLAPVIAATSLKVLELLSNSTELRDKLESNAQYFRKQMAEHEFDLLPGQHPIIPIMLGDARVSQNFAKAALEEGVYVIGFFYPVVPNGKARIRTQMSAGHSRADLDLAVSAFVNVKKKLALE